ncbi:MAG TPA: hypothetical protein VMZ30_12015 [Pyrinomonadaceae bacterium]|nr:hypothetical protein [Pyrinomonadaceae bacterium]
MMLLDDKGVPNIFLYVTGRFRRFLELSFPFIFLQTHSTYNNGMGRLKIKKKEVVLPFRDTLAYRMFLLSGSIVAFVIALYITITALRTGVTPTFVAAASIGVAAVVGIVYNMDHLRYAKIPQRTLNKMKRR